jgi:predicted TIM-barrel fold metal-dependent hydrolase
MIDGYTVVDAIVHAHNFSAANCRNRYATLMAEDTWRIAHHTSPPGYRLARQGYVRDWSIEEVANVAFVESDADIAVHHVLPIRAFHDGGCSLAKTVEAKERWPDRFVVYAGVDPMEGSRAIDDLEEQVALLAPVGVKLYPNSWVGDRINGWYMDDPEIAYPVFERARQLGLGVVAVHKALPVGPVRRAHYGVGDVEGAAMDFPDLQFEIVHGGMAFVDDTASTLARFPNVWVNLETTTTLLTSRPVQFERALAELLAPGRAIDRVCWGSGSIGRHPQPPLEAFVRDFQFSDEIRAQYGVAALTPESKQKILASNYARLTGIDVESRVSRVADDEFARARRVGLAPPFSTTRSAACVE